MTALRSLVRSRAALVLAAFVLAAFAGSAAIAADPQALDKPAITPVNLRTGKAAIKPDFNPVALPDSMSDDVHAAWALRRRLGAAYWPAWAEHTPAPLVVRGNPTDFFILHPDPPELTTSPRVLEGGGYYHTSMERLALPKERDPRIEFWNHWWCISYNVDNGRRSSRSDIITLLVTRDFMVYETSVSKPTWGSLGSVETIMTLRSDPDLVTWLDQEATAIRSAVLTDDPKERNLLVDKAVKARHMAEERTLKVPNLKTALDWFEAATKAEGAAHYIEVLAGPEARAVAARDTAHSLTRQGAGFAFRAKAWRAKVAAGKERDVMGASLGTLREVGALYCVLLDATGASWQADFFDPTTRLVDMLDKARKTRGNSQAFGG